VADMLEDAGLFEQFCGTWVRGLSDDDIARVLGADPSSKTTGTMHDLNADRWRIPHNRPVFLIGSITDAYTLAVEPQSYLGAVPDRLCRLSTDGGQAINIHWTVNLASGLALAQDGAIVTSFSLTAPHHDREGTDPDRLDRYLEAAGVATGQNFNEQVTAAFSLIARLTGAALDSGWFTTRHIRYLAAGRR
jgi:hypothetical protein